MKENEADLTSLPNVKVEKIEEITDEIVTIALKKALKFTLGLQAEDGHWPAETSGPLFYTPLLVCFSFFFSFTLIPHPF